MKLMYDILSINARLADADRALADAWENSSMPQHEEFFDERQERYAILAIDLLRTTGELRSRYDIPSLDRGTWNPLEFLNDRLTLSRASQEARAERARELAERLAVPEVAT